MNADVLTTRLADGIESPASGQHQIVLVQNWLEELKRKVPEVP
jgi:hypothetical protein